MDTGKLDQSNLDRIAEEFSAAMRRGDAPSVEEYVKRHADPSGQLRELLSSVAMIEELKRQTRLTESEGAAPPKALDQLDDYTIVCELGRGGMGTVYEAMHQTLGRRVAIKVVTSNLLGQTKQLARFRVEARAAARLRHSNIVPVFGVGSADDCHYYVMDFIDGTSLREWLAGRRRSWADAHSTVDEGLAQPSTDFSVDTPQQVESAPPDSVARQCSDRADEHAIAPQDTESPAYFRWVAQMGATICDALAYAHSRGVLHRDIKPANLLLDRRGGIWVADFGLAKLSEQSITMTGDVVGTPQYMAPEAFDGSYDVRSEVYSVGLTLYELLALRPAIEGKSTGDTIRKATQGVREPPRKYNRRVPRELETIVLKALEHAPTARYESAAELRDDLQRYLNNQPTLARRPGPIGRAVLWSRREPLVALLTTASFVLLSALAGVSATAYFQTRAALTKVENASRAVSHSLEIKSAALATADKSRARAEKNLQVALAAFEQVMRNITDRSIEVDAEMLGEVTDTTAPNVTPEDARLLQTLLGFFDKLAANNSEDLLPESAVAARRAGDIYVRLGRLFEAERAFNDALERYQKLGTREPDDAQLAIAQLEIMNELAVISGLRGRPTRAAALFMDAEDLLAEMPAALDTADGKFQYARAHRLFASVGSRSGWQGPSAKPLHGGRPRGAMNFNLRVRMQLDRESIEQAIELLEALIEEEPEQAKYRAELARAFRTQAEVFARSRARKDADAALRESIEMFESLLKENRRSDAIRYELAMTLVSVETFGSNQMYRAVRTHDLCRQLLDESPTQPRYLDLQARALENLALLKHRAQGLSGALEDLEGAEQIYTALIADYPQITSYKTRRSQLLDTMADVYLDEGRTDDAITALESAISQLQPRSPRIQSSAIASIQLTQMRQKLRRIKD